MEKLFFIVIAFFIVGLTSCSEEGLPELCCVEDPVEGPEDDIVGKWKLLRTEGILHRDYAGDNICYEFGNDGDLGVCNFTGRANGVLDNGSYNYILRNVREENWGDFTIFGEITIEGKIYGCYLSSTRMALIENPAVDGVISYFLRIK